MREHPTIGADTLQTVMDEQRSRVGFLEMGLDIAWCHHERWDGKGYPRGLAGEDIPLAARILSLADCYDALTTSRPYKEAWPHAEAMAYLVERAGLEYDPTVFAAFRARAAQADEIRRRLADSRVA